MPATHLQQVLQHCLLRDLLQSKADRENWCVSLQQTGSCNQLQRTCDARASCQQPSSQEVDHARNVHRDRVLTSRCHMRQPEKRFLTRHAGTWQATSTRAAPTTLFQCSVTALAMSSLLLVGCTPCTSYCLVYFRSVWTCAREGRWGPEAGAQAVSAPASSAWRSRTDVLIACSQESAPRLFRQGTRGVLGPPAPEA